MGSGRAAIVRARPRSEPKIVFDHLTRRREVPLFDGLLFGRSSGAEKFPHDELMSGKHLLVHVEEGRTFIEDLDSTNGTKLNGQTVPPRQLVPVSHGDVIKIGKQKFRCRDINSRDKLRPYNESFAILGRFFNTFFIWGISFFALFLLIFGYSNRHYRADMLTVENPEEQEFLEKFGNALKANSAQEVCNKLGESDRLRCLRQLGTEMEKKDTGLSYIVGMYDLNTRALNQDLSTLALNRSQKVSLKLDWLDNVLHVLDLMIQKEGGRRISFSLPEHYYRIHAANAALLIVPLLDRIALHTFQVASEIEPSLPEFERDRFRDLRANYTELKQRLLAISELNWIDRSLAYIISTKNYSLDTTYYDK